jgi:hypothetical protein
MRKIIFTILTLLLSCAVANAEVVYGTVLTRYDLDSTTDIACVMKGQGGIPLAPPISVPIPIKTVGASANVAAVTASTYPFADVLVGDIIIVNGSDRLVITRTDADNIVVDTDITIPSGSLFAYYRPVCAADGGWFPVIDYSTIGVTWQIEQYDVTGGISMRLECRGGFYGAQPVQVWPACTTGACGTYQSYTGTAGVASRNSISTEIDNWVKECRVLMKIGTSDDGTDTTTHREMLYIGFSGSTR